MAFVQTKISVPSEMLPWVEEDESFSTLRRNAMLLYPYIKDLALSHGKAAGILGIPKDDLIQLYAGMGIPYFNDSMEEIERETDYYRSLKK